MAVPVKPINVGEKIFNIPSGSGDNIIGHEYNMPFSGVASYPTSSRYGSRIINATPTSGEVRFNGLAITRPEFMKGSSFNNPNANIANRVFQPGGKLKYKSRINNDYRKFRGGYDKRYFADPNVFGNNPVSYNTNSNVTNNGNNDLNMSKNNNINLKTYNTNPNNYYTRYNTNSFGNR